MRRQAVVNANVTFRLRIEGDDGEFSEEDFCYPKGIEDYVLEKVGADYLTEPFFIEPTVAVAIARICPITT